jgi:linoleoyl-CoA desaturase
VGRVVTLPLGVDPDYWRTRHVDYHHVYANVEHYDLDTEENGFFRQTPFQRWRPHMRYQHLYWPLIAALSLPYIAWIFDWSDRLDKTPLREKRVLAGRGGWTLFVLCKLAHLALVLVVPLIVGHLHGIGWGWVLLAYALSQMCASLLVVFLLLGTHWAQAEFYPAPTGDSMPQGWYRHNFATACDWQPEPRWLEHLTGGLNYHLTHHLFPGWNHRHYPALAAAVAEVAQRHGMAYRCIGYRELLAQQQRFLRRMGQP